MEYYTHQQQQQQLLQQVDGGTANNANNNNNNNNNNSSSSCNTTPTSNASASSSTVTADAATVAIAKDMLQLHHGGGALNNNNNTNNNNNNNNNSNEAAINMSNSASISATNTTTITTTTPPVHAASIACSNSSNSNSSGGAGPTAPPESALGFLKFDGELLYISEPCTVIGRNSSTSHVHFDVAENNLVSRKHFQVLYDEETRDFYIQCLSKNGIFVDDFLHRRHAEPLKLPSSCYFRFPSTEIRIQFESFVHATIAAASAAAGGGSDSHNNNHSLTAQHGDSNAGENAHVIISPAPPAELQHSHLHPHQQPQHHSTSLISGGSSSTLSTSSASPHLLPVDSGNVIYSPLKISIPKKEQKSPYLSPTGTISAANSCPASPRQGFHQNANNYNNYGNNNLQNQDQFQTPSTASYNHNEKPPYSYAQLIVQAISAAQDKQLTLSGIYSFIVKHYPYYRKETNKGWQNSIRHNLSLNRYFIKVARSQDEPGKGSFWRIDPDSGAKLIDHSYKKRRQRSSQGFRPSYGMPRSAPVSPSHMDNSRESSPLQDIVLQSAPGSPGMSMENRAAEVELLYNSQNMHQTGANNSQHQYSGNPYFITTSNQNSAGMSTVAHVDSSGNGVGALIALKRNHAFAAASAGQQQQLHGQKQHQQQQQQQQHQQQQQQQQQTLHPDIIYEELPTDYSGNMESGEDECDAPAAAKRPKYISEVL